MRKKEIKPLRVLDGQVTVPGSKSYTARALVIAALASGETLLRNALSSEDAASMIRGLKAMGVRIEKEGEDLRVTGTRGRFNPVSATLHLEGAGTAVRFLTAVAGLCPISIFIDGNERMRERPIQDLLDALQSLGVDAKSINGNGCPPVAIGGGSFRGGRASLRGEKSSQYLSSILLASPYAREEVIVQVSGDLVSGTYVDMTMEIMKEFGVTVAQHGDRIFHVAPGPYHGREYSIEGDFSGASYFFAAAAITGGRIEVRGINPRSSQGDAVFPTLLESMGCEVRRGNRSIEVVGRPLKGIDADMKATPDTVQTLAVVAAFAEGETRIFNVNHLRHKETDRLLAIRKELFKMGIETMEGDNLLIVKGGRPRGAEIETYQDHRMAMAFAVAGLRVPGMVVQGSECVSKSFPRFWDLLEGLG